MLDITFTSANFKRLDSEEDDPMTITTKMANFFVRKTLIDIQIIAIFLKLQNFQSGVRDAPLGIASCIKEASFPPVFCFKKNCFKFASPLHAPSLLTPHTSTLIFLFRKLGSFGSQCFLGSLLLLGFLGKYFLTDNKFQVCLDQVLYVTYVQVRFCFICYILCMFRWQL